MLKKKIGIANKILIGMILGVIAGLVIGPKITAIAVIGDVFLRLLRMSVVPLIFANVDDDLVPVQNSEIYADSLMNKGIPVDIIVYPYGGHGWGSKAEFDQTDNMAQKMEDWVLDLK